jgi:hypothetical protein
LRLYAALVEDPVHFEAPPEFSNGITEHRFTVRGFAMIGEVDLSSETRGAHAFALTADWQRDRLLVAVWLQAGLEPLGRFASREVVQATHAVVGDEVLQEAKGVLAEMYSATWCEPCLYGDLAMEEVAISLGGAAPLDLDAGPRYFRPPPSWSLVALAAICAGVAVEWSRFR